MSSENHKDGHNIKQQDKNNKKRIKHDPQAESARIKFGKDKEA